MITLESGWCRFRRKLDAELLEDAQQIEVVPVRRKSGEPLFGGVWISPPGFRSSPTLLEAVALVDEGQEHGDVGGAGLLPLDGSRWPQRPSGGGQPRSGHTSEPGSANMAIRMTVNGEPREVEADGDTPLLWVLRDELRLTGT